MFEHLATFDRIIVTGPQRSGTTITARIIAHDTGLEYIDEQEFQAINVAKWRNMVRKRRHFVMQAPGMCRYVHEFGHEPDLLVVMVKRPIADIVASQRRINWQSEAFELARYDLPPRAGVIAEIKYGFWDAVQKHSIENSIEICYNDLDQHPLWLPAGERLNFGPRQWQK